MQRPHSPKTAAGRGRPSRSRARPSVGPRRGTPRTGTGDPVYQLKLTLLGTEPPIWRRIQVPGTMTLDRLHRVLQRAMGWTDSHLHEFLVAGRRYSAPHPDGEPDVEPESAARLGEVAPRAGAAFVYLYDFGDDWRHEVLVEEVLPAQPGVRYPVCLGGARRGPPEDCGGVAGYEELLAALQDPEHPEHGEMLAWVGGRFDAEAFDLGAVNRALRRLG